MKFLFSAQRYNENKPTQVNLPMITLLLMISFATFNAVLFTPALPNITRYFSITNNMAQLTITWFLLGYAIGQLLYGPLANRYGRKSALYAGIIIQIVSNFLCIFSGVIYSFFLLVFARFFLAISSGVGLTIAFTLVNESFAPEVANQKIAYLILALSIMPGLSIALGGILNHHYGWMSCFYAGVVYGLVLLFLTARLTETSMPNPKALKFKYLLQTYLNQLKNPALILGGLLMGGATCFIYIFTTLAPFIALDSLGMSSSEYGIASILPPISSMLGALVSAQLAQKYSYHYGIRLGIFIAGISVILMVFVTWFFPKNPILTLFFPVFLIWVGLSLIYSNASTFALNNSSDKAHGSAVMNFINLMLVTLSVLSLSFFSSTQHLLLATYTLIIAGMTMIYRFIQLKRYK